MKKELTPEQVAQLFEFTRKHYVEYYDVQVELVDHLASAIETEMEQDEKLSFDSALNHVFSGFGIFGFDGIQGEKADAVWKKHRILWLKTFFNYFTWPAFIKVICIWLVLFELFQFLDNAMVCLVLGFGLTALSIITSIKEYLSVKKQVSKKLVIFQTGYSFTGFCYIPIYINQFFGFWLYEQEGWLLSTLFSIMLLMILAYTNTFKKIVKEAKFAYPEAFKDFAVG